MTGSLATTLMVQGTGSSVGKSLLVTALCRIFRNAGVRVAPFKAQNMSLNSWVTPDGGEIGRAQAVQAAAAGLEPSVEMNPILLKPECDMRAQVVVLGRPVTTVAARDYPPGTPDLRQVIADSLASLRRRYELIVIEGAGSPAEINLRARDLVNMHVARLVDAPVLLVGDIDRGGVFAALVGTLALLEADERARVRGFVINKFRGDRRLLDPGLVMLRERTGVPVLGVVPMIPGLRVASEDSVALDERPERDAATALEIAVIRLPRIANFDDFDPLDAEPDVTLRFVERGDALACADLVVVPGSKSTVADLRWMVEHGFAAALHDRARRGAPVLGICGGCQMLGGVIEDPEHVESAVESAEGLGLLPLRTRFGARKRTARVCATAVARSILGDASAGEITGYEIHMGAIERTGGAPAAFEITTRNGVAERVLDGAVSADGNVVGTMLHGLFANDALRAGLLNALRARKGLATRTDHVAAWDPETEYDRLAAIVAAHLDVGAIARLAGIDRGRMAPC